MAEDQWVEKARSFAIEAHGDQRYGDQPYVVHLDQVAGLVLPFGERHQVVGYLHDTVEDTSTTAVEIASAFDDEIARFVSLISDEPGPDRRARKVATNAKLAALDAANDGTVLVVKVADRLANVRSCVDNGNDDLLTMYRGEHRAFHQAVWRAGLAAALWSELDDLIR